MYFSYINKKLTNLFKLISLSETLIKYTKNNKFLIKKNNLKGA